MVAFHFPPLAGSSGIQRTLRFVQQLPKFGWQPLVVTAHERAYEQRDADAPREIPGGLVVQRAQAFDAARHLALRGRHLAALARPDRWMSWKFDAVRRGLALVRDYQPQLLWSTFPIATAHAIGAELHRRTRLPWVADFRDPMAQDDYPDDPATWRAYDSIERATVGAAAASVFTTPGAVRMYRQRYPAAAERVHLIENGYDEASFEALNDPAAGPLNPGATTLLHSGIVYPSERDPTHLFAALGRLAEIDPATRRRLKIRFRAPVHVALLQRLAAEHGVGDVVECLPAVAYRDALAEMCRADGLLVLQASNCNAQIPAKLYEYLRCGRPILGLADPAGDTAAALLGSGAATLAPLDDAAAIAAALGRFVAGLADGGAAAPRADVVAAASRFERTRALATLLDQLADRQAARPTVVRP